MQPRQVIANEKVEADRGLVAIERGPLVYCAEGVDNDGHVLNQAFSGDVVLETGKQPSLLGGITTVKAADKHGTELNCIPYYAWGHRGANEMRVWFPVAPAK
jgi:hypothetical protein